jgi:hypothetical protein
MKVISLHELEGIPKRTGIRLGTGVTVMVYVSPTKPM